MPTGGQSATGPRARAVIEQIGTGENHDVGPRSPSTGSRSSARKYVIEPERLLGIQEHDVQVAAEPTVLKAVVEHNQLGVERLDGSLRGGHPIGILHVGQIGQRYRSSRASSFASPEVAP